MKEEIEQLLIDIQRRILEDDTLDTLYAHLNN